MVDIVSLLPQLLVYALLIFAAFILFRQIRKFMKGETGCAGCSTGGCSKSTGGSCCGGSSHKKDELKTIKR
ncbi:FeoB-associated Cys-rich membrane protein [Methanimicrococcus blatticola]|uniref:Attachment p12 family protein n=1 Tax=Methanimicrococcus blatticola TaxID=91560 RepID=A0A484F5Q5_9EURY|nr:FeoB-associated Cys-rich membrane protein [Methanimicrococcus blatticola]MBZ3935019.1 hypothetical protein [Methanimicrococcus blatticola]MCC2508883.1 hypothetical protein [Methanimicrococcus blatticola]TDQ71089.1 hypothetical protein C7391_0188 [Methanimicrococcus blatticola]